VKSLEWTGATNPNFIYKKQTRHFVSLFRTAAQGRASDASDALGRNETFILPIVNSECSFCLDLPRAFSGVHGNTASRAGKGMRRNWLDWLRT
jgi:hypothetical protein